MRVFIQAFSMLIQFFLADDVTSWRSRNSKRSRSNIMVGCLDRTRQRPAASMNGNASWRPRVEFRPDRRSMPPSRIREAHYQFTMKQAFLSESRGSGVLQHLVLFLPRIQEPALGTLDALVFICWRTA